MHAIFFWRLFFEMDGKKNPTLLGHGTKREICTGLPAGCAGILTTNEPFMGMFRKSRVDFRGRFGNHKMTIAWIPPKWISIWWFRISCLFTPIWGDDPF